MADAGLWWPFTLIKDAEVLDGFILKRPGLIDFSFEIVFSAVDRYSPVFFASKASLYFSPGLSLNDWITLIERFSRCSALSRVIEQDWSSCVRRLSSWTVSHMSPRSQINSGLWTRSSKPLYIFLSLVDLVSSQQAFLKCCTRASRDVQTARTVRKLLATQRTSKILPMRRSCEPTSVAAFISSLSFLLDVLYRDYSFWIKVLKWLTEFTSSTASDIASSSLWFIQCHIKSFGNLEVSLVATPDFFPSMTLAPSDTNATQFSWSHSSVKPALVKQVSNACSMPSALWFSSSTSSRNMNFLNRCFNRNCHDSFVTWRRCLVN